MADKEKTEPTAEAKAPVEETKTNASPELTVNDLNSLKQIIDVASQRGAFKPSEMTVVGQTYTKLEAFLQAVTAAQGENKDGA
tara:strand:- start:6302 stop:6550 length:249 start_codon:yes stop_codon:yes gene_type:complete